MKLDNLILKNTTAYIDGKFILCDVHIIDHKIFEIGNNLKGNNIIDLEGNLLTPSFIDAHVHLREPGFEHKEDIKTGSLSAIKGGYSHIMCMPNTNPVIDTVDKVLDFNKRVEEKSYCHIDTFASISIDQLGNKLVDIDSISKLKIAGFSDDGHGVQNDELMKQSMIKVKEVDSILSVHCEDTDELGIEMGSMNLGNKSLEFGEIGINNASEYKMIKRDLELLKDINCRYHVCHISTSESLELIKKAKLDRLDVTCEVTPHHLILCDDDITKLDTNYKMNPPLRSKNDLDAIIKGLNEGFIDMIATDHAPHSKSEKARKFKDAPFGIIGLDMAFSLLYTKLVLTKKVKLKTILDCMTINPANRFRINDYGIKVGNDVNLCVIDLEKEVIFTENNIGSKASNSPFLDMPLIGSIQMTLTKNKVYDWRDK